MAGVSFQSMLYDAWDHGLREISVVLNEIQNDAMDAVYARPRVIRRVEDAKRKARSELKHYGWDTLGHAKTFRLSDITDNINRVDASSMSVEEFRDQFERVSEPCVLLGLTKGWQANYKWTTERIARKYRNQKFKCGEDDDGYSVKLKMKYYVEYMKSNKDDSPLYIFDSSFGSRHKTGQLLEDYTIPVMFQDDLFNYADFKKRPPHRWFVMGPARSGTGIHIDPLGTSAWNTLIQGHKRWVMISPNAPKALVKPRADERGKHPDEAVTWFNTVYHRVRSSSWPKEYRVIEARQGPGETMFVPSGWWHVVINEDETIAVTQNYCSVVNLPQVWPKTVSGRPKLSKHWFKRLSKERPEVIPIMEQAMKTPVPDDSSSDSSSSSSSSDDSTSEEDMDVRNGMARKRRYSDIVGRCEDRSECASKLHSTPPM